GMDKVVKKVIKGCEICQRVKSSPVTTKEELIKMEAKETFEKVYIDICGLLKETYRRKRYILAMIDHYSRYTVLVPIGRQDEETVIGAIEKGWILRYGTPGEIHTDCEKVFVSKNFQQWVTNIGSVLCLSSPYHHITNGVVERLFRTIREYVE